MKFHYKLIPHKLAGLIILLLMLMTHSVVWGQTGCQYVEGDISLTANDVTGGTEYSTIFVLGDMAGILLPLQQQLIIIPILLKHL